MALKTRQQIRDEFAANGVPYSAWARQRGYSPNMVIAIITDDDRSEENIIPGAFDPRVAQAVADAVAQAARDTGVARL